MQLIFFSQENALDIVPDDFHIRMKGSKELDLKCFFVQASQKHLQNYLYRKNENYKSQFQVANKSVISPTPVSKR